MIRQQMSSAPRHEIHMGFDYEDVIGGTLSCFQPVTRSVRDPSLIEAWHRF
jgi:hypothetical protein